MNVNVLVELVKAVGNILSAWFLVLSGALLGLDLSDLADVWESVPEPIQDALKFGAGRIITAVSKRIAKRIEGSGKDDAKEKKGKSGSDDTTAKEEDDGTESNKEAKK